MSVIRAMIYLKRNSGARRDKNKAKRLIAEGTVNNKQLADSN